MRKFLLVLGMTTSCLGLVACHKKESSTADKSIAGVGASSHTEKSSSNQSPPLSTADNAEQSKKQAAMDYAVMEDAYMNDPKAQWANQAKANSTYGDEEGQKEPDKINVDQNMVGKIDGRAWTNNHQDIGFDWAKLSYEKPVFATEVRIVFPDGKGIEAVSKIELEDTSGEWHTVWSGISDQKKDNRGDRTWFVKSFEKTTYLVKGVKLTIANNLYKNYKSVDAVQLVGEAK